MNDSASQGPQGTGSQDNERPAPSATRNREEHLQWVLQQVRQALTGLKFGQVVITVQDGLAIQIERTEKTRLR
ncbi:MAG: YezD family protein [Planctomycetia bacterium]|nr:YezD family protein [Planctomycetia bacterium]